MSVIGKSRPLATPPVEIAQMADGEAVEMSMSPPHLSALLAAYHVKRVRSAARAEPGSSAAAILDAGYTPMVPRRYAQL
jgi:hypothetical protein